GLAGRIASGTVRTGERIVAQPGGLGSVVTGIDSPSGPVEQADAGDSVTILLRDELDIGRGQVLAHPDLEPIVTSELTGVVCWLAERASTPGQRILVKVGTKTVRGLVTTVGEHWDVDAQEWVQTGQQAQLNDIVRFVIRLADPVAVDDYYDDRATGGFLVIDPASGGTLAAGMVGDPLTRAFDPSI
ncbi:MAG: hypothetical protein Q4P32_13700, partial [Micrococcales bacterium]|nr:hypothetical protein [Micrococcales bacterium]